MLKKSIKDTINELLTSKKLKIKTLTSAGIITGIVSDIFDCSSNNTTNINFLDSLLDNLSSSDKENIKSDEVIYVIENTKLFPISNLNESIYLDRIELNSSKIIALCPLFSEVD